MLYRCPCGDQPVAIPDYRQRETYLDGAYWCSTVMSMLDFDGSVKYVWNPFSLAQLKDRLGDFDAYLDCVASKNDASCVEPTDAIFEKQQISLLSVYQRCLSNYQEETWDQGSFVMFNQTFQKQLRLDAVMPAMIVDTFNVSSCLLQQKALGYDNTGCLVDWFLKGSQAIDYFEYSNITASAISSDIIDACLTFSGPAALPDATIAQPFIACLENSANRSGCDIPHMLWSGRSTNKVPVATQHTLNISDEEKRKQWAQGEMDAAKASVLAVLDKIEREWTGSNIDITVFSSEGDLFHQYADCVMLGPLGSMTLTPGPSGVEKAIWSRNSAGESTREFEIPCTGGMLANRNGSRDDMPPFTCGTYARRAVMKYFLRNKYGGTKSNPGARQAVVQVVKAMINATLAAWSSDKNFMCTCPNKSATGWECCMLQSECATEPCPCPDGYQVAASVACCTSVCDGLAGSGLMAPFSYIGGAQVANDMLSSFGGYLQNDVWTSTAPWLLHDPDGAAAYQSSWNRSQFVVANAGLFDASNPVVYYDEIFYPFKSTFWAHCTGLLQQAMWTLPLDRSTGKPKGMPSEYDPINGQSQSPNLTYIEDFIQTLTQAAYVDSPIYWHYSVRHTPSQSEVCKRTVPRRPNTSATFSVGANAPALLGFSSMTLGGLGGTDCYCGWWNTSSQCRIPDALCTALVQILGFTRICLAQKQLYNASDHLTVLAAIQTLVSQQPSAAVYPCPSLQISDHWGFMDPATGLPFKNATAAILNEGVGGFRVGNADWLFATQTQWLNPSSRVVSPESLSANAALTCNQSANPSIADLFIDELFPSAQGVRQSMPQSYCIRYGIELARLTVYEAAKLADAASQQQGVVSMWRVRCQYKLEELAVCNSFRVFNATGGSKDTSRCPFALSVVQSLQQSYAVTPGCLLVLWNTAQDGIYDPCICVPCANTPNIDVPAQLTSVCRLESFQRLVSNDVIPGESAVPLASGSFRALMDKPGLLQVNTPDITHWALHTSMRDADLTLDWWPDAWAQPAGYHVTPGCSVPGDAHWKTFDASWRWDSKLEQMVFARDETNDPLLSRNAFGASGVCRANNYGMPMTMLNTMAVCTKENANAKADPMVPSSAKQRLWVDGSVNCAADAFSTPWSVDRALNPPRQWAVGTLQQEAGGLAPFTATEWGQACGPYPLSTCTVDSDCASGLSCIIAPTGTTTGVCQAMVASKMECATHSTCSNNRLCSGDGICVQGVWQIKNSIQEPVSFRSYSQSCETGTPLDTWGTSIAENLPDILNASGLCSYRSWFENRRMSNRNQCNQSDTCQFSGFQPWNFSAPNQQTSKSAFDSGVLALRPSQCDVDYQFYQGFSSCTPSDATVFDTSGNVKPGPYTRDNRTITYRPAGRRLPLIHYADEQVGESFGFTGVPATYQDLGMGTSNPSIVACASQHICGPQPSFMVNNQQVDHRLVIDDGITRGYTLSDLLACGVFGILQQPGATCQLDFAVVPLASYVLTNQQTLYRKQGFPSYIKSTLSAGYTQDKVEAMRLALQMLPSAVLQFCIGGPATTLQDYVVKTSAFIDLYSALGQINKPTYANAGVPRQIYNVTTFGAYEVPFAWWYKCAWLAGNTMGNDPVDSCSWQATDGGSVVTDEALDPRLAALFGLSSSSTKAGANNITLLEQLIRIPGVITQQIVDQAYSNFTNQKNTWADRIGAILQLAHRQCSVRKEFVTGFSDVSQGYQLARLNQMYSSVPFDLSQPYVDSNGIAVCSGSACLNSIGDAVPLAFDADFVGKLVAALKSTAVLNNTVGLESTEVPDEPYSTVLQSLFSANPIQPSFWQGMLQTFQNMSSNCAPVTQMTAGLETSCLCATWEKCSDKIQSFILNRAKVTYAPLPKQAASVGLSNSASSFAVDVCSVAGMSADGVCFLNNGVLPPDLSLVRSVSVPIGTVVELYGEQRWKCTRLTCDSNAQGMDGKVVPAGYVPFTVTNQELLAVREYTFNQKIGFFKQNPWISQSQQINEILCEEGNRWYVCDSFGRLCDKCMTKERFVDAGPNSFKMKTRSVEYYINNTLKASVQFYPCIMNGIADLGAIYALFNGFNTYRNEPIQFPNCSAEFIDTNGMPVGTGFSDSMTRPYNSTFYPPSARAQILESMKTAIDLANQNIVRSSCMLYGGSCSASTSTLQGSVVNTQWGDSDIQATCGTIKNDRLFGCLMYPGERTQKVNWGGNEYNNLLFRTCLLDDSQDSCKSQDNTLRDMQMTGQTFIYDLLSTTPTCSTGPVAQCTLLDEIENLGGNIQAACPGTDTLQKRNQDYFKLVLDDALNTNIIPGPVLSTESVATGVSFDHLFVGLKPGFQCCSAGCKCSATNQIPVQMRTNLWQCLDCPLVSQTQCTGTHNCRIASPLLQEEYLNSLPGWNDLTPAQIAFLTSIASPIEVAASAVEWFVEQVSDLWTSSVGARLPYAMPSFMQSFTGAYEYNPTSILSYDATMQVNSKTCTETGEMPDFSNCSYDSHRRELKRFSDANYKVNDGIILYPGETLQWHVGRAQMMSQNIPQWESIVNRTGLFLVDLFDDKWCLKGNIVDNACYVTTSDDGKPIIRVLNPGLLGAFEPSIGCDTQIINQQRVVYSYCSDCSQSQVEYDTLENGYTMTCPKTYVTVKQITADFSAKSNLCSKTPESTSSSCANRRGVLGGAYSGTPVDSLYARQTWVGGLPIGMSQNPLLQGKSPSTSIPNIALSPGDIGGHYIRMVLSKASSGYTLSIQGLPLLSYASALSPAAYGLGVSSSSPKWTQIKAAQETYALSSLYPNSICAAWDCPLRRRAFYMGIDAKFRPSVPDPLRTQIMYGTRVHPTQASSPLPTIISQTANRVLGVYVTSNGFCACMTPPCTSCTSDLPALYGQWTTSSAAPSGCTEQLDWPYAGGTLRDGASFNQRWTTKTSCGIMDRLPAFQYRYVNRQTPTPSTKTTLDKGGVCHMGWPAVTAGPMAGCYILTDTDSYMCPSFTQPKSVSRLRAKTVAELLNAPTRPRLSDCSPPPSYKVANSTVASEVSYGQLKRIEAARLLANDLRRRLCGNSTVCEPSSKWSLPTFWSSVFMANFPSNLPSGNGANETLWTQPWVACKQSKDGSQECDGTIKREDWIAPNRTGTCLAALTQSKFADQLAQDVNVCDLDSTMDLFCRTVQDARYHVFEANCLYSGQCRQKLFFYQPSTYGLDNGEFVRNTVQTFYNDTVSGACVPDQDTAAAIAANAQNLKNCAALQLNVLVHCIQIIRVIVGSLVELVYYSGEVVLYVFELIGAKTDQDKQWITTQINALVSLIQNKFITLYKEIGDLFYNIVFDGPMGSWLLSMIQAVCNFLDWLFSDIVYVILCWTRTICIWFLQNWVMGFMDLLNGVTFGALGGVKDQINQAVKAIEDNVPCTPKKMWSCNLPFLENNVSVSILPMPTRCWAGVEPQVGGSLACSAADTCIQLGDFSNIICGACPVASSMTRFGCDSLTKLCTCSVFPVGVTSCASHEECTMDNSDVSCQYVDSYLKPSYGNVPCGSCPKPMCLITDGSGTGKCSCLLRAVPLQTCSGIGQLVSPDASDLCLVATAGSGHSSSNSYSANYRTLASVPCMLLNQAQTWCYNVFTSATVSSRLVVGLSLLSGRRRLLMIPSNATPWNGRGEPCLSLVTAQASELGILERYTKGECQRWYEIGLRLVAEANMTTVSPFLLVSWRDMVDALLNKDSLVEILAKMPFVIHRVLLHSEFTQPIYILAAYWSKIIPTYVWENQTLMDSAKEYLFNASHGRRLLQEDSVIGTVVTSQTTYQWSQGPYSWPPNYVYWDGGDQSCAVVSTSLDVIKNGLDVTVAFYKSTAAERPDPLPVEWPDLRSVRWPTVSLQQNNFNEILSNLTDVWPDRVQVRAAITNASYISSVVSSFIRCDFERVQTCTGRHSLFWSAVQMLALVALVAIVARVFEIPYVEILLVALYIPLTLYTAYGFAPTCVPLVPVCLLPDLLDVAEWFFPATMSWPAPLVTVDGCQDRSCLRSCVDDPTVGYASMYDHAAWIMCEVMGSTQAVSMALTSMANGDPIRTAVLHKCVDASDPMRAAQRICFAVTVVNSLPIVLLAMAALWLLPSVLGIAVAVAQGAVNFFFTFILFVHSQE